LPIFFSNKENLNGIGNPFLKSFFACFFNKEFLKDIENPFLKSFFAYFLF